MVSFFNLFCFLLASTTPPEKTINKYAGFRSKKAKANQNNWQQAQRELILFSRKMILPTGLLGVIFTGVEVFFMLQKAENTLLLLILLEVVLFLFSWLWLYLQINKKLSL